MSHITEENPNVQQSDRSNWDYQRSVVASVGKPGLWTMFSDPTVGYAFSTTTAMFMVKKYGWSSLQTFLTAPTDYSVFGSADSGAFQIQWHAYLDELWGYVEPPPSTALSIGDARGMSEGLVTVEGIVTWQAQWDNRTYFLQDGTGGISTFHESRSVTLNEGDRISISGKVGSFRGEVQVNSITAITVLTQEPVPAPRVVTGAQINGSEFQGELVEVVGTVQQVTEMAYGNQRVTIRDAAGTDLPVYVDTRVGMVTADWPVVGTSVRVTGVLGTDDRSGIPEGTGPRIEVRRKGDVVAIS